MSHEVRCYIIFSSAAGFSFGLNLYCKKALKIFKGSALPIIICIFLLMLVACDDSLNFEGPIEYEHHREAGIAGMSLEMLEQASKYAGGSGIVMRGGKVVYQWGSIKKKIPS